MSYKTVAEIQTDQNLARRITACAALEGVPEPHQWVPLRMWAFAAQPGWGDAWASAKQSGIVDIGNDESVITDGMILAAVQGVGH